MALNMKQLKQIIQYNSERMYFGNWTPKDLSNSFKYAKKHNTVSIFTVNKLTNDNICDILWQEMSLNPLRYGTKSPFKTDEKNDIRHFKNTYKPSANSTKYVVDLSYKINSFVTNLYNAEQDRDFDDNLGGIKLYTYFFQTGKLPTEFRIFDNSDVYEKPNANPGYRILGSLCSAIHIIATQNWQDLRNPVYKEQIIKIAQERYPTGERSDTYPVIQQPKTEAINQEQILENKKEKIIQLCLPFENSGR